MLKFQVRKNETENQNGNTTVPATSNNAQIQVRVELNPCLHAFQLFKKNDKSSSNRRQCDLL